MRPIHHFLVSGLQLAIVVIVAMILMPLGSYWWVPVVAAVLATMTGTALVRTKAQRLNLPNWDEVVESAC